MLNRVSAFAQPQLSAMGMADNHFAVHLIHNKYYKILNIQIPHKHIGLRNLNFCGVILSITCERDKTLNGVTLFAQPRLSAVGMADNHFAVYLIHNTYYKI
jgi:hypothetical protein